MELQVGGNKEESQEDAHGTAAPEKEMGETRRKGSCPHGCRRSEVLAGCRTERGAHVEGTAGQSPER